MWQQVAAAWENVFVQAGAVIVGLLILEGVIFWRRWIQSHWTEFWDWIGLLAPNVPRQRWAAWLSIFGSVVALIATLIWLAFFDSEIAEPASQVLTAFAWMVVSFIQLLIPSEPEWEVHHAKRARYVQGILQRALDAIEAEKSDFLQIVSRQGRYNHAAHRKAVEVDSFEILLPTIKALRTVPRFRREAAAVERLINQNMRSETKDVSALIPRLDRLTPGLAKEIERLEQVAHGLA